ncbi:MAG: hypothetical protein A2X35_02940 [Elusimicrobia bacterium GWA2_61_42]|nr:MAG: hypothetical protein A2X35_02940 [Elusimicrobia bacterium GWA2_61_42]OGR74803.1 MAG: hypothetical protein A2X38_08555 [Elusimicrobia bacterium GWC2_61_25]
MKKTLLFCTLAFSGGSAFAFHPLISEDTAFLGRDVRQAEITFEHSVSKEGFDFYSNTVAAEFSYGLFDKIDIMISAPWQGWSSHGLSESGLGDVSLETKFEVARDKDWTFALKPGFSLPAGNEAKSLGAGKGGVWVYGIAGKTAGPRHYYLNAGYRLNRNSLDNAENILKASAAAALEVLPKTLLSAELAIETSPEKDSPSHPVTSVFGLIWSPSPSLDLDAGVKFGLNKAADDLGLLAGFTLRL